MPINFYHQHDSTDCGPTCLRIIANYYGKDFSLEYLREQSFIGKDGVSLLNTKILAEKLGFETISVKMDFQTIIEENPLPCILHWNQNHFVVYFTTVQALVCWFPVRSLVGLVVLRAAFFDLAFLCFCFSSLLVGDVARFDGEPPGFKIYF